MPAPDIDRAFAGSIPRTYETYLVPMIFEPYAVDIAGRLRTIPAQRVLEIAAGTGVVTRLLASTLAPDVSIVASDLNPGMLDHASSIGTERPVLWRQADAMALPFDDASFDVVVCQFGVMFFPDRARGYAEVLRVLAPGGAFVFNAWDRLDDNEFAACVTEAAATVFPDDPPRFLCAPTTRVLRHETNSGRSQGRRLRQASRHCRRRGAQPRGLGARSRRWAFATVRHCEAKSRRAIRRGSAMSSMRPLKRSRGASATTPSTAGCSRT